MPKTLMGKVSRQLSRHDAKMVALSRNVVFNTSHGDVPR